MTDYASSLLELDLSVRFSLFLSAHVVLYFWARYVVAPAKVGAARMLRCVPLIPVLVFLTHLFHPESAVEFVPVIYCATNFIWLTTSKLWSFCLNRGQLVRSYDSGSNTAFALSLLFPITVAFNVTPAEKKDVKDSKKHAYEDARFSIPRHTAWDIVLDAISTATRLIAKVAFMVVLSSGYQRAVESGRPFWRDVCLGWFIYSVTSSIEDITAFLILITANIKVATNFDCPWMSKSVTEFWSRRYNVVFGQTLRDLAYDPICEGSWVHGPSYLHKERPSSLRRAVAVFAAFTASGLLHIVVTYFSYSTGFLAYYGGFFVVNGIVVILEQGIHNLRKSKYGAPLRMIPQWMSHVYAFAIIFTLGHLFFWRDLVEVGLGEMMVNGVMCLLRPS